MTRPDTGIGAVLGSWLERWAVGSQQVSRRNAMIALTALTQRRAELIEVEEYLAALREPSLPESTASVAGAGG
jgi:hypothetical protein